MTEQTIELDELRAAVAERYKVVWTRAEARAAPMQAKAHALAAIAQKIVNRLLKSPLSPAERVRRLWPLIDEKVALAKGIAACKKGCSHCCHIPVGLTTVEAEIIGKHIGKKPRPAPPGKHGLGRSGKGAFADVRSGYDNPCPFLENDLCSIYEVRPVECRQLVNLDVDNLLCHLHVDEVFNVPYMDMRDFETASVMLQGVSEYNRLADIREFFPTGRRRSNASERDGTERA